VGVNLVFAVEVPKAAVYRGSESAHKPSELRREMSKVETPIEDKDAIVEYPWQARDYPSEHQCHFVVPRFTHF